MPDTNNKLIYKDLIPNINKYFTNIGVTLSVLLIIISFINLIFQSTKQTTDQNNSIINPYIENILKKNFKDSNDTSIETNFIGVLNIIIIDFSKKLSYESSPETNIYLKIYSNYFKQPILSCITSIILLFSIIQYKLPDNIIKSLIIMSLRLIAIGLWLLIFMSIIYIIVYTISLLVVGYFYDATIKSYGMNLLFPCLTFIVLMILKNQNIITNIKLNGGGRKKNK